MEKRQKRVPRSGIFLLSFLFTVIPTTGCGDPSAVPEFQASGSTGIAEQNFVRGTFFNTHTFYVDCLGGEVRFFGYVEDASHEGTTGSGDYQVHFPYGPKTPNSLPCVGEGQSSGSVRAVRSGING